MTVSTVRADSPLGAALTGLKDLAHRITLGDAVEEYNELFIGVTQGELVPFKSFYLTGFLNEKPLAELRAHMDEIGIAKADDEKDPEDHIASLCEMMHGLIVGDFVRQFARVKPSGLRLCSCASTNLRRPRMPVFLPQHS